jgi:hypothetical protein
MIKQIRHFVLRVIVGLIRAAKAPAKAGWKRSQRRADDLFGM